MREKSLPGRRETKYRLFILQNPCHVPSDTQYFPLYHPSPIGGAKPKTPRPDLVPSTPPKDNEDQHNKTARSLEGEFNEDRPSSSSEALQHHPTSVKFMTPPPTRSVNVSEIAIQTSSGGAGGGGGGMPEPFRMEDLERKLSEVDESVLNSAARSVILFYFFIVK